MRLFNPFKAFSPHSSQDIPSTGEDDITVFPPSSRKRRRLKRRPTRQLPTGWQAEETKSLSGIQIPDARNQGFRSAPDLLDQHQVRDRWSPIRGQSAAKAPNSPLRENFDGSPWREYEQTFPTHPPPQNADPPRDDRHSEQIETPIFGPREQGFFRNEMPYDMDSPLSQLASGWREPPHSAPRIRKLPTPPIRDSLDMYGMSSGYSKEIPPPLRDSPQDRSTYRSISPEVSSRHSSEIASAHFRESPSEWRRSPEIRPPPRSRTVSPEASFRRDSRSQHSSNAVDGTYYIVPGGVDVIFQDGAGNEITRQIVKLLVHAHPDEFVELAILAIKAEMVKDEMGKQVATIPAALETTNKMDTKEVDAVIPVPGLLAQNCRTQTQVVVGANSQQLS